MLRMLRRILRFCGSHYAARIRLAYVSSFLKSVFSNAPVMIAVMMISMLMQGKATVITCCMSAGLLIVCFGISAVMQNISDRLQSSAGYEVFAEKRISFAEHLRKLPMGYFTEGNMGKISSILSDDMVFIEENAMSIAAEIISNIFSQLILVIFLACLHPVLGAASAAVVIIALCLGIPMNRESLRNSALRQHSIEEMTTAVLEYVEGFPVSRSFCLTGESAGELRSGFGTMCGADLQYERQHAPWERRLMMVYGSGSVLILTLSIMLYEQGGLRPEYIIGVMLMLFSLFTPVKSLLLLDHRMTIMEACLNRLDEVFAEKPIETSDAASGTSAGTRGGSVEFRHVSFAYDKEEVLHDISFKAEKGEMVALTGESGSGKTTIANLIARFWDITEGEILLDGTDIRSMSARDLMSGISMVFQNVYLFEDTIYNNIAMGRPGASYGEVEEAAKKARCFDFIMKQPYGFETRIGEGGHTLSGGERQRISIARCILKDAPVVILDEATASLDADNEFYIQEAMSELCRDKTVIVIAHRLYTIKDANRIIVLDKGRIIENGSHEELIERKGAYYRSWKLSGKEAAHE